MLKSKSRVFYACKMFLNFWTHFTCFQQYNFAVVFVLRRRSYCRLPWRFHGIIHHELTQNSVVPKYFSKILARRYTSLVCETYLGKRDEHGLWINRLVVFGFAAAVHRKRRKMFSFRAPSIRTINKHDAEFMLCNKNNTYTYIYYVTTTICIRLYMIYRIYIYMCIIRTIFLLRFSRRTNWRDVHRTRTSEHHRIVI